jgi:hypothetical protein
MPAPLPPAVSSSDGGDLLEPLRHLLESAHTVWANADERRRMRFFGFRPAVEAGVLKREWHGMSIRVSPATLLVARPGDGDVAYRASDRSAFIDGRPLQAGDAGSDIVREVLDLIESYERWVEAREGRQERINRGHAANGPRRRPLNPLAETRRLQRLLQTPRRPG